MHILHIFENGVQYDILRVQYEICCKTSVFLSEMNFSAIINLSDGQSINSNSQAERRQILTSMNQRFYGSIFWDTTKY